MKKGGEMKVQVQDVGFGYSPFPHTLSRDSSISLEAKGLFAVYGSFVSESDPTAYPSKDYLCKLCGVNEKTFQKYKRELLLSGWISQEQRIRENGQYSTILVTRYFHPSLNPFHQLDKSIDMSAAHQKTEHRKTERRKLDPQEQKPFPTNNQKNTLPKAVGVGVSLERELTETEKDCIEWTIQEAKRKGTLKNEMGLRCRLTSLAQKNELQTGDYLTFLRGREQAEKRSQEVLSLVDKWKEAAEKDPPSSDFWEQKKRQFPGLFR